MSKGRSQSPESLLESAIAHYLTVNLSEIIPLTHKMQMAHALADFVIDSAYKYQRGSIEHGGVLPNTRDLHKDMRDEIMDMFWYNAATKWK
jgi:hypothetical protein